MGPKTLCTKNKTNQLTPQHFLCSKHVWFNVLRVTQRLHIVIFNSPYSSIQILILNSQQPFSYLGMNPELVQYI